MKALKTRNKLIFWVFLGAYLAFWATVSIFQGNPSAWASGDYQTMNTLRYWERDGIAKHYGLFMVQGYTPLIRAVETPELNHHGLASVRESENGLVQSIYYNHYPGGYLIPEWLLSLLIGVPSELPFHVLQYIISIIGLIGLYLFLKELFEREWVAQLGTAVYAFSTLFLTFSYTLANQPIDDATRFLIMWLIVKDGKSLEKSWKRTACILGLYTILSLSTLDSLVFVFIFAVGYDLFILNQKRWLLWASYAAIAVGGKLVQLWQSVLAFGLSGAQDDLLFSFSSRTVEIGSNGSFIALKQRFYAITLEWVQMLGIPPSLGMRLAVLGLVIVALCLLIYLYRKSTLAHRAPLKIAALLSLAAASFPLLVPVAGYMGYQGRQWFPAFFVAILWTFLTYNEHHRRAFIAIRSLGLAFMLTVSCTGLGVWASGDSGVRFAPVETPLGRAITEYAHNPRQDIIFFYKPENKEIEAELIMKKTFAYQLSPHLSYQADRLLMESTSIENLLRDIKSFELKTNGEANPVVLFHSEKEAENVYKIFRKECRSVPSTPAITPLEDWFAVSLNCPTASETPSSTVQ